VHQTPINNESPVTEPKLSTLFEEYADIFAEPKALPPHGTCDHQIILKEGTSPVNVRPYRYPTLQKDVIERIVKEMLESGVVRRN